MEKDLILETRWLHLVDSLEQKFHKKPDLQGILFLIGVQELGKGSKNFSKEEKQDLMHLGICRVLSQIGMYSLKGHDKDGWPHWELTEKLPFLDLLSQETLLKEQVIAYFDDYL